MKKMTGCQLNTKATQCKWRFQEEIHTKTKLNVGNPYLALLITCVHVQMQVYVLNNVAIPSTQLVPSTTITSTSTRRTRTSRLATIYGGGTFSKMVLVAGGWAFSGSQYLVLVL